MRDYNDLDWYGVEEQTHLRAGTSELTSVGTAVRCFLVRNQSKLLDETSALFVSGIPPLRSVHPTRPYLWCSDKQARQADDKNGQLWEVVCNYSFNNGAEKPWQEPPVYSWSASSTDQVCDFDVTTDKPIRNSAGVAFDPPVMATRYEAVLTVSKNVLNFNIAQALQYVGAVNSSAFYGAERGFVMCVGIPATTQYYVDEINFTRTLYWSVQYSFAFRNKFSWQPKVLDAGYVKKGDGDKLIPITIGGREPSSAVPLNGSGQPLENPDSEDPTFLDFKVYPELNFSSLGV